MANTQAISGVMKQVALGAVVDGKGAQGGAVPRVSDYQARSNSAYTATGEVSGTNYTAGGVSVTNANTASSLTGTTAYWTPSAAIVC